MNSANGKSVFDKFLSESLRRWVRTFPADYFKHLCRLRGIDLRQHGSGNLGATNVSRVLGWKTGIVVLVADMLKGALPVYFLPQFMESTRPDLWALGFGVAAIVSLSIFRTLLIAAND